MNARKHRHPLLAPDENMRLRIVLYRTRLVAAGALMAAFFMAVLLVLSRGDVTYRAYATDVAHSSTVAK